MGRWIELENQPGAGLQALVLMTNGTVLARAADAQYQRHQWLRLTASNTGSFVRGTWGPVPPMVGSHWSGSWLGAIVLARGDLLAWGGEPTAADRSDLAAAELYLPARDRWIDALGMTGPPLRPTGPSTVLADGRALIGPDAYTAASTIPSVLTYDETTNAWAEVTGVHAGVRTWTLLHDGSILRTGTAPFDRFIPSANSWVSVALPSGVMAWDRTTGPAIVIPDGRVWMPITSSGSLTETRTVFYVPSRAGSTDHWEPGPDFPLPAGVIAGSYSSACLLPSGHIFFQCRDGLGSLRFYELDVTSRRFVEQPAPDPIVASITPDSWNGDGFAMVLLPDGTVLVTHNRAAYIYDPEASTRPRDAWRPRIHTINGLRSGVTLSPRQTVPVVGYTFAGLSEAHSQPERPQATNYPLVRVEYDDDRKEYWPTSHIVNRAIGITGLIQSFQVTVPSWARLGHAFLYVVTNAIPSAPFEINVEVGNRFWIPEVLYRDGGRLIGNLADGGYIIVRPGGIQPVGPWDPTVLERLDGAVKDLDALALARCADWKRVMEVLVDTPVTVTLASHDTHAGRVKRVDADSLTIQVGVDTMVLGRSDIADVFTSAVPALPTELGIREVLVYRRALPPGKVETPPRRK